MADNVKDKTTPEEDAYTKANDPINIGKQATERRQAELLKANDLSRKNTAIDYDSAYKGLSTNNFRNFRSAIEGSGGLSGGMAQGRQNAMSALEMSSLGNFMSNRKQAMNDLDLQKLGIAEQAQNYGQQQLEIANANQQSAFGNTQQDLEILNASDKEISPEDKRKLLKAKGWTDEQLDTLLTPNPTAWQKFGNWLKPKGGNTPVEYTKAPGVPNRVPYDTGGFY